MYICSSSSHHFLSFFIVFLRVAAMISQAAACAKCVCRLSCGPLLVILARLGVCVCHEVRKLLDRSCDYWTLIKRENTLGFYGYVFRWVLSRARAIIHTCFILENKGDWVYWYKKKFVREEHFLHSGGPRSVFVTLFKNIFKMRFKPFLSDFVSFLLWKKIILPKSAR